MQISVDIQRNQKQNCAKNFAIFFNFIYLLYNIYYNKDIF